VTGGPGVLVVVGVIRSSGFAFYYPRDIILASLIELLLLCGADNIIRGAMHLPTSPTRPASNLKALNGLIFIVTCRKFLSYS